MSEFQILTNLDLAKETGQRNEPKLPHTSTATEAGHSVGIGAPSHCPTVLKVTRKKNLGAQGVCKLQCKETVLSVGLPNMERPQTGSYSPPIDVSSSAQLKIMPAF